MKNLLNRTLIFCKEHPKLLMILVMGFLLRITGLFSGIPFPDPLEGILHPDEIVIIKSAVRFPLHIVTNLEFNYPTFFGYFLGIITLPLRVVFDYFNLSESNFYFSVNVIGRLCSALAGTGTVLLVYFLAREIYDRRSALLSCLFLSLSLYHVHNSSFATTDVLTSFFLVLFLIILRYAFLNPQSSFLYVSTGVVLGMLVGTKYTGGIVCIAILFMYVYTLFIKFCTKKDETHLYKVKWHLNLLLCGIAALATFVLTTPGILLHFQSFVTSVFTIHHEQVALSTDAVQQTAMAKWLKVFSAISTSTGWPLAGMFIFGIIFPLRKNIYEISFLLIIFVFFLYFGPGCFPRYIILITPLIAMIAGNGALWIYDISGRYIKVFVVILIVGTAVYSFGNCVMGTYTRFNDTRTQAARYIQENIPPGTSIGIGYISEFGNWESTYAWKYPKIDFTHFRKMDYLDYPGDSGTIIHSFNRNRKRIK